MILTLSEQQREQVCASMKSELSMTVSFSFGALGLILVNSQCKHANCKPVERVFGWRVLNLAQLKPILLREAVGFRQEALYVIKVVLHRRQNGKGKVTSSFETFFEKEN